MQIALVSRPGQVLDAYTRFFEAQGTTVIPAVSIFELYHTLPNTTISGFVVDIQMAVRASETEKNLLQTLEGIFPNIRTNWNPAVGFRALSNDNSKSGEENLIAFLQNCRDFKERALRKDKRMAKYFNALFCPIDASEETAQRAYTLDISSGGLFVGTCDPPAVGSLLLVTLQELHARPFKILVKWRMGWGIAMCIPGFGGSFVDLDSELVETLEKALTKH